MAHKYQGKGWMLRWLRRCPECGGWLALRTISSEHDPVTDRQRKYKCRKCDAWIEDWKPSEHIKLVGSSPQSDPADFDQPAGESNTDQTTTAHHFNMGTWDVIVMLVLIATMQAGSYFILDDGWLLLIGLSAALGWFVYAHVLEHQIFVRRLIADAALKKEGWAYHPVVKARIRRFILFVLAFIFSGSFLLHANQMPLYIWVLIYLDVFILKALLPLCRRPVESAAKPGYFGIFQRMSAFLVNIAVLTTLVCTVSFFMPVADSSHLSMIESGQIAWDQTWQSAADPIVGSWGSLIAAIDAMQWNFMQQLSHVDFNPVWKFLGWVVFLIIQAMYLWVIQSAMLGVLAIRQKSGSVADKILGKSRAAKWGWGVFYLLIIIWLTFSLALGNQQQAQPAAMSLNFLKSPAPEKIIIDPCKDAAQADMATANQTLDQHIEQDRNAYNAAINPYIDTQVDQAFAHAVNGVDRYLDWYFTVVGEWQRLATVAVGDIGTLMQDKMTQFIIKDSGFEDAIYAAQSHVSKHVADQFTQTTQGMITLARQQVEIHPCSTSQQIDVVLPSLSHDMKRMVLSATTTAAAGTGIAMTTGAAITTKLAATASAKLAAKVLAKMAAKTAAKAAGSYMAAGAGALAGLSCGPAALICSTGLAVVGFFGVDALFMEGDELLNRKDMRRDMIRALMRQRDQIKAKQKANYHAVGDAFFSKISNEAHAYFVPAKHGF